LKQLTTVQEATYNRGLLNHGVSFTSSKVDQNDKETLNFTVSYRRVAFIDLIE